MPWISNTRLETYLLDAFRLGYLAAAEVALDGLDEERPKGDSGVRLNEAFVAGQRENAGQQ